MAPKLVKVGNIKKYTISKEANTDKCRKTAVFYTYKDIQFDIDGWADSKRFLPDDFDLVYMRLKREKTVAGWIAGTIWIGLRLKPDDKVIAWKRKEGEKSV
jgi:hypothetical protein